jgi:hypothetical protein
MIDAIQRICPELQGRVRTGRLECRSHVEADAAVVFQKLREFGGEGWVCLADNPVVLRFGTANPFPEPAGKVPWLVSAEAAKDNESLHVARDAAGWILTEISLADAKTQDDILLESTLKARAGGSDLKYDTSWCPKTQLGLEEIRPVAFRFAGFAAKQEK